jgi:hypothetical protein
MAKKSGNFLEQNIDKMVLVLVGIIGLAILAMMVVRSPNTMTIDKNSYGPADIDQAVSYKTSALTEKLSGPVQPRAYTGKFNDFKSAYAVTVNVPQDIRFPLPAPLDEKRLPPVGPYREPKIGQLSKSVIVGVVSGVADVPLGQAMDSGTEPGDVDLVTVQCSFNLSAIFTEMQASFANEADLQEPVFAAVELQRQEMNEDGTWPAETWLTVKRIKPDRYGDILDVEQMKSKSVSEAESLRAQLTSDIQITVLRPDGYIFRSRVERWLPPELEEERQKLKSKTTMPGSPGDGTIGTQPSAPTKPQRPTRTGGSGGPGTEADPFNRALPGGEMGAGRQPKPGVTPKPQPVNPRTGPGGGAVGSGMPGAMPGDSGATPEAKLETLMKPASIMDKKQQQAPFWASDDSVQPGKTYRYRVRLGLLNPIAGRGRSTTDPTLADKFLFWSDFSSVTQPVEISARTYLFATKYNEASGAVTIEVAKYQMARWEKKLYDVKPGEMIGRLEKMPPAVDSSGNSTPVPDVDFATGMIIIDVETVTEYRPGAQGPLTYQQAMYKGQDNIIRPLAVKMSSWPKSLRKKFTDIETAMKSQPAAPVSYIGSGSSSPYMNPSQQQMPPMQGAPGMQGMPGF